MFSLRFSGSKFLITLRWQFRVRKIFSRWQLCTQVFEGLRSFHLCLRFFGSKMRNLYSWLLSLIFLVALLKLINRLSICVFVLVNGILFNRFKWFKIRYLAACLMNLKKVNYFKEIKSLKSLKK